MGIGPGWTWIATAPDKRESHMTEQDRRWVQEQVDAVKAIVAKAHAAAGYTGPMPSDEMVVLALLQSRLQARYEKEEAEKLRVAGRCRRFESRRHRPSRLGSNGQA